MNDHNIIILKEKRSAILLRSLRRCWYKCKRKIEYKHPVALSNTTYTKIGLTYYIGTQGKAFTTDCKNYKDAVKTAKIIKSTTPEAHVFIQTTKLETTVKTIK